MALHNHDPSATSETVFAQSELVKAGLMVGPRIFSTGTIIYGADGDLKQSSIQSMMQEVHCAEQKPMEHSA